MSTLPTTETLLQAQHEDSELAFWYDWLRDGIPPEKLSVGPQTDAYQWWHIDRDNVILDEHELLVRLAHIHTTTRARVVRQILLPVPLRRAILFYYHNTVMAGHAGHLRTYFRIRDFCYWRTMTADIKHYLLGCTCYNVKNKLQKHNSPLGQLQASIPNYLVAMDCAGPLRMATSGHTHILVITDHFTKFVELIPLGQPSAVGIVDAFVHTWALRYGPPQYLVTDNGPEFSNELLVEQMCRAFQITKVFSTAYHPEGNGMVERFMRTIKQMLLSFIEKSPEDWAKYLPVLAYAYNTSLHDATGEVPQKLFILSTYNNCKKAVVRPGGPSRAPTREGVGDYVLSAQHS